MLLRLHPATQAEAFRSLGRQVEPISILPIAINSSSSNGRSSSAHSAAAARSSAARDSLEHCLTCLSKLSAGSSTSSSAAEPAAVVEPLQQHCSLGGQWVLVQVGDWLNHPQGWTGPAVALLQVGVCAVVGAVAGLLAVLTGSSTCFGSGWRQTTCAAVRRSQCASHDRRCQNQPLLQVRQAAPGWVLYTAWEVGPDYVPTGNSYRSGRGEAGSTNCCGALCRAVQCTAIQHCLQLAHSLIGVCCAVLCCAGAPRDTHTALELLTTKGKWCKFVTTARVLLDSLHGGDSPVQPGSAGPSILLRTWVKRVFGEPVHIRPQR